MNYNRRQPKPNEIGRDAARLGLTNLTFSPYASTGYPREVFTWRQASSDRMVLCEDGPPTSTGSGGCQKRSLGRTATNLKGNFPLVPELVNYISFIWSNNQTPRKWYLNHQNKQRSLIK